jgi:hypothetical protein
MVMEQVRFLTSCQGFAPRAPAQMQPWERADDVDSRCALWNDGIAGRPGDRKSRLVCPLSQRFMIAAGMSGDRRNATRAIVRECLG